MTSRLADTARFVLGSAMRLLPALRRTKTRGLTIFVFHDVTESPSEFAREHGLYIEPERFHRQIAWIESEFRVAHPDELVTGNSRNLSGAAIISFDDGWAGTFRNALPILEARGLPSVLFLNPGPIVEGRPTISAEAIFLSRQRPDFVALAGEFSLSSPSHLTIHPRLLAGFEARAGRDWHAAAIEYQGALADRAALERWGGNPLVRYGSHLYEHWNSCALTDAEFGDQFTKGFEALRSYPGFLPLLAFPNGRPGLAYGPKHVMLAKQLGAKRVFSGLSVINPDANAFELHRVSLARDDWAYATMWFRLGRQQLLPAAPDTGY